ncbi:hypothetical protein Poli38472_000995 [Pythium oligandrum]|uniref:Uncharacterized protein n=1 Tax=Pythium oligandrum TaxID=41045 RepID=A0A8K1CE88_PYTOL|nr:hypothetical protein Poli38472_000995 [Pythium oligandrum]|eukprot:TMW60953.1 hypothetical protein Poli38472_000995 [Pythium oligandrum]
MNSYSSSDGNVNIRPAGSGPIKPDVPLSINTSHSYSDAAGHSHETSYRLHVGSEKSDVSDMSGEANLEDSGVDDLGRSKKSPGKRSRAVKNPNRSTKSKARPGLRKGKWTEEEERYATQLTTYFKEGLLPIERGTMLRLYLSQKLNCEPMRITKKFTGGECIGKQVFRPCSPTPESRVRLMQAQLELVALEAAFIKKLKENKEEVPGLTDDTDGSVVTGGMPPGVNQKKRRSRGQRADDDAGFSSDSSSSSDTTISSSHTVDMKRNVDGLDDASAVGLLLDFFYKASRKENDSDTSSSKDGNDASGKTVSSPVAEPDPETDDYVGPMKSANEELASSPIKRMRTLSISNCVTDVTSPKRSRVGSFTIMASN